MSSDKKLLELQDRVKKLEETTIRVEEKKKYLEEEKEKLITELKSYGIDPENATGYLEVLDTEIQQLTQTIEINIPIIPEELINK